MLLGEESNVKPQVDLLKHLTNTVFESEIVFIFGTSQLWL